MFLQKIRARLQASQRLLALASYVLATGLAFNLALLAGPAAAQVCSLPLGGVITCPAGPPVTGVTVVGAVTPVTVNLANGVQSSGPINIGTLAGVNATIVSLGNSAINVVNQPGLVVNSGSGINAQVNTITTAGNGATGALLRAVDAAIFASNDAITTAGNNADGVNIQGRSVTLNANAVNTGGNDSNALNLLSLNGPITVNANALRTNGLRSDGELLTGTGVITSNVGLIQTNGDQALGASISNNTAACVLLGRGGCGVNGNFGSITTNGFGGIGALVNATGPTNVTVNALRTNGGQAAGLSLNADPTACITLGVGACGTAFTVNNLTTTGANSPGALVRAAGPVNGNIGVLQTNGANAAGLDFASNPNACVVLGRGACDNSFTLGQLTTSGAGSTGALIRTAGTTTANINTASTSGVGATAINIVGDPTACVLLGAGACNTNLTASRVTTQGDGAGGVLLNAPARLVATLGVVQTSGANATGVQLITDPALCVVLGPGSCGSTVTAQGVTTTGPNSPGVGVTGGNGPVMVSTGPISTSGPNSPGIAVMTTTGDQTIIAGPITTTGANSDGIDANASGCANVSVTATGAISAAQGFGINASSACRVTVTTQPGAPVSGGKGGIIVASGTGATVTIGDRLSSSGGAALTISGAPAVVTIQSTGDVVGRIALTSSNNTVTNNGRIDALGDSSFGAGADVLINTGTIAIRPGQTAAGSVTFTGLATTTNSGLIDLRNGVAGDTLNVSGAFVGTGASTLAIDVSAAAPAVADRLIIAGAATGSTGVIVNPLSQGLLTNGLVVARGGVGTSATAFGIAPGTQNRGFVAYSLAFNAATNEFALFSAPNASAYETVKLQEAARESFYRTDDAVSGRLEMTADSARSGEQARYSALWGVAYGGQNRLRGTRAQTIFGQTSQVDIGYEESSYGVQFGYDRIFGRNRLGVTGGFSNSFLGFASNDKLTYRGANIGAYGQYLRGPFFANVIGRYERYSLAFSGGAAGFRVKPDGSSFGGRAEAGLYYGGRLFIEPHASLDYVHTSVDGFSALASTFDVPDADGLRGRAGVRIGRVVTRPSSTVRFYAGADAVHEFVGDDKVNFSNNGVVLALKNQTIGTYGQAKVGASFEVGPRLKGYIEGFGNFGSRYTGGGGRAAISLRF